MKRTPAQYLADMNGANGTEAPTAQQPAGGGPSLQELEAEVTRRGLLNQKAALPPAEQEEGPHAPY